MNKADILADILRDGCLLQNGAEILVKKYGIISREFLLDVMRRLNDDDWDTEYRHVIMDRLLLAYVDDDEITEAFEAVEKWY